MLVPLPYVTTMKELYEGCPVSTFDNVREVIESNCGRKLEDMFECKME